MKTYSGEVVSGAGHMSQRMGSGSIALGHYEEKTGAKLVSGSLNIKLAEEVDMPSYSEIFTREDHEGKAVIYITPGIVNELPCHVVRRDKSEEGKGRHPKSIVELISAHNLRQELQLEDGDTVTLQF